MKVDQASFLKSAMNPDQYPRDGRPEFAFVGRSNVGKSSLLNTLLGRKGLAKTSATPGKTQTINFFDVNGRIYFVDLPGYGYAKVPKAVQQQWGVVMTGYLRGRDPLRLVVQLVDARHAPTEKDADMLRLLDQSEKPTLVVATKIDKLARNARRGAIATIREKLDLPEDALVVPFSAVTREGAKEIWSILDDLL